MTLFIINPMKFLWENFHGDLKSTKVSPSESYQVYSIFSHNNYVYIATYCINVGDYCFQPEHNVLSSIRREFGLDWKHVGLALKLDKSVLNIIELDSQHHAERAFNMLSEWQNRDTTSCYCKLISAMSGQGLESGVKVLKEKIKSSRLS